MKTTQINTKILYSVTTALFALSSALFLISGHTLMSVVMLIPTILYLCLAFFASNSNGNDNGRENHQGSSS